MNFGPAELARCQFVKDKTWCSGASGHPGSHWARYSTRDGAVLRVEMEAPYAYVVESGRPPRTVREGTAEARRPVAPAPRTSTPQISRG